MPTIFFTIGEHQLLQFKSTVALAAQELRSVFVDLDDENNVNARRPSAKSCSTRPMQKRRRAASHTTSTTAQVGASAG